MSFAKSCLFKVSLISCSWNGTALIKNRPTATIWAEVRFFAFNNLLIDGVAAAERIIAFDPSYISKAGKSTYGKGKYWSGVAGASKLGLEIGGFAVVDVKNNSAFHLQAYQTPASLELKNYGLIVLTHYGNLVTQNALKFKKISDYMVANAYFSKAPFMEATLASDMHLISRLPDDSVLF